ncbi:cyclic nucleotide-binding domain-containing protein [bacterium]|nr:cyclic nucleotide-binding domain-containing protein [bacterium]
MTDNQRSGMERRVAEAAVPVERRNHPDRRTILKESDEAIQRLRNISMFNNLSVEQLDKMVRICSKKKYSSQEQIYRMGEESKDMFILMKGKISITFNSGVELKNIVPTGTVGEMGVFTGEPRSASVLADTDCIVLNINKAELFTLFRNDMELCVKILLNIIRNLSEKVRTDNKVIEELMYRVRSLEIL